MKHTKITGQIADGSPYFTQTVLKYKQPAPVVVEQELADAQL